MSERLIKLIGDALIKEGASELSRRSKLSPNAIREIAAGVRCPRRRSAYRLALACGCNEQEALALARECFTGEARESA
jgi:hypothetical protein